MRPARVKRKPGSRQRGDSRSCEHRCAGRAPGACAVRFRLSNGGRSDLGRTLGLSQVGAAPRVGVAGRPTGAACRRGSQTQGRHGAYRRRGIPWCDGGAQIVRTLAARCLCTERHDAVVFSIVMMALEKAVMMGLALAVDEEPRSSRLGVLTPGSNGDHQLGKERDTLGRSHRAGRCESAGRHSVSVQWPQRTGQHARIPVDRQRQYQTPDQRVSKEAQPWRSNAWRQGAECGVHAGGGKDVSGCIRTADAVGCFSTGCRQLTATLLSLADPRAEPFG